MEKGILIKNGVIITMDSPNKVLHGYALHILDDKINRIAPQAEFSAKYEHEIDANCNVVLPGMINAHMHFYSTLIRGLGKAYPSRDFVEILENLWWRLDRKLELEDTYYSALIMLIQAIRNGTTTLIDHHASPGHIPGSLDEIERAVKQTGLRSSLCYELSD
ncbi:MAG TPA: amidohydrolase family protein, partial [Candidatus Cloacimonadota bacterium]|nr:amidohydrolase family protein [Candidatus Cloacimonadota bacterium]